ncbi:MAG: hypothetical protein HY287_11620 [Planctomycetes bacterium]|nr:hypothetical protein [Planctomycetota bacterium]
MLRVHTELLPNRGCFTCLMLLACTSIADAQLYTSPPVCYPLEGDFVCVGGTKSGNGSVLPLPINPPAAITSFSDAITDATEALVSATSGPVTGGILETGGVTAGYDSVTIWSVGSVTLLVNGDPTAFGFSRVSVNRNTNQIDTNLTLVEDNVSRTLQQTASLVNGQITTWGSITQTGAAGHSGGYVYSASGGATLDPNSDSGFSDAVMTMLHVTPPAVASSNVNSTFILIGSIVSLLVNYILDVFVPYTPPTTCQGPQIMDGVGQSCNGYSIPCRNNLDDMCERLDEIPGVSTAFKKCMKGRCGCGGSHHPRATISCSDNDHCGPCGGANGCNYGGNTQSFYCMASPFSCDCVEIMLHEVSHACGIPDEYAEPVPVSGCPAVDYSGHTGATRMGLWFKAQCCGNAGE